jgi:hypothetical protein
VQVNSTSDTPAAITIVAPISAGSESPAFITPRMRR